MAGNAQSVSDAFNARAAHEGWGSLCDPCLEFRCSDLSRMLALWREKTGARPVPARGDFSLRCLKGFLRDVAIYERVMLTESHWRYRVRLMGTAFAETMGDLTGKFLDAAIPKPFLDRWYAALDATFDADAPLRFVARSNTANKSYLVAEYFEAPLLSDGGEKNLVLAASHFSAGDSWTETLPPANAVRMASPLRTPI
jgi:hypothetical protein